MRKKTSYWKRTFLLLLITNMLGFLVLPNFNDVNIAHAADNYDEKWGQFGQYELKDVVFDERNDLIYVAKEKSILVFDKNEKFLREINHSDFESIIALAVSQVNDDLIVVDQGGKWDTSQANKQRIHVLGNDGTYKQYLTVQTGSSEDNLRSINTDSQGNLYVTNWQGNVTIFSLSGGTYTEQQTITDVGSGSNQPTGAAIDSKGNLYISLHMTRDIWIYKKDANGDYQFSEQWNPISFAENHHPAHIYIDDQDQIYIFDKSFYYEKGLHPIYVYDKDRNFQRKIYAPKEINAIEGRIKVKSNGRTFVTYDSQSGVFEYDSEGNYLRNLGEIPEFVKTHKVTEVKASCAKLTGLITPYFEPKPTQHGFVWSEASTPDINLSTKHELGAVIKSGTYSSVITGITPATTYYVRAYAIDAQGNVHYGAEQTFTTELDLTFQAPQLAAGGAHSVSLKADGTVWTWGNNEYGQLGDGAYSDQNTPVQVKNEDGTGLVAVDVDAGEYHTVALDGHGRVWTWGYNGSGQLGNGEADWRQKPNKPYRVESITHVKAIAAGAAHTVALKSDGTVWTWGANGSGQLGTGKEDYSVPNPEQVMKEGDSPFIAKTIFAGYNQTFAIDENDTLWTWGTQDNNVINKKPIKVTFEDNSEFKAQAAAAGEKFAVALDLAGNVWTWGYNGQGQLGIGTTDGEEKAYTLSQVSGLEDVKEIEAGFRHVVVLKKDGSVNAWGYNEYGQLGNVNNVDNNVPVQVLNEDKSPFDGADTISAGGYSWDGHSLALKNDGMIIAWGKNEHGQLGNGTNNNKDYAEEREVSSFSVEFDAQGGSAVESQTVGQWKTVREPAEPTKEGYIFEGWYNDSEYKQPWNFQKDRVNTNITLYAKWSITIVPIDDYEFAPLTVGYMNGTQEVKEFTITKTGAGEIHNLSVSLSDGDIGDFILVPPTTTTLNDVTTSTNFYIKAKKGLSDGWYSADVSISADHMQDISFDVSQYVESKPFKEKEYTITTVAGTGFPEYNNDNQLATQSNLNNPSDVAIDSDGNLYILEKGNNRIRKVNKLTNEIETIAGTGVLPFPGELLEENILAKNAKLHAPTSVALDSFNNIYIIDSANVRKIDSNTGNISTLISQSQFPLTQSSLANPYGLAVDSNGDIVITDQTNHRMYKAYVNEGYKVYPYGGSTDGQSGYGGNGFVFDALLNIPSGITMDGSGNVYFADAGNHFIRKIDGMNYITSVAGTGYGGYGGDGDGAYWASLHSPSDVAVDGAGNLYIADKDNYRIRKVNVENGYINTIAGIGASGYSGDGGLATLAEISSVEGITVDPEGNVYIADKSNNRVRKLSPTDVKETYTVTFETNGGSLVNSQQILAGEKVSIPDAPTKTGSNFAGWYTDPYFTEAFAFDTEMITDNITLYAKWLADKTYTIAPIPNQTFTDLTKGYASGKQETKAITITRIGTGDLENLTVAISGKNAGDFELVGPAVTKLDQDKPTTSFTVKAKDGLAAGTYTATITVKATCMNDVTFTVTQVVKAATKPNPDPNPGPSPDPNPNPNPTPPTGPTKEEIVVDVRAGEGEVISKTPITRTTEQNGTVKDEVTLTPDRAKESADQLKNKEDKTARIVIPDEKDKVSQVDVKIPTGAVNTLAKGKANFEIYTENVRILIPNESLNGFNKDLYFRLIPIKKEEERKEVETRAKKEEQVREIAKDQKIKILGRPMTIETNMQSRPVTLILPLKDSLPKNGDERQEILDNLVIFIEHSDGTKELIRGEFVPYKEGEMGVQFNINKFSTFTMVYMKGWKEYFAGKQQAGTHKPYIHGYLDGTFGPEKTVTRAQMAAMLARNLGIEYKGNGTPSYTDATSKHWAFKEIEIMKQQGIMMGRLDGRFGIGDSITRAEMATIVDRWMIQQGKTNGSHSNKITYTDLSNKHWAYEAIMRIQGYGIMEGSKDHTFKPDQKLTRAEAVKVLNRLFNRGPLYGVDKPSFTDVPNSHWAFKEIEEAAKEHQWERDDQGREIKK